MRPYLKTVGRRKRRGIISPQYPYIMNQIHEGYANLGRFSTIWLFLGPIFRKTNISDISFKNLAITSQKLKCDKFSFYFS